MKPPYRAFLPHSLSPTAISELLLWSFETTPNVSTRVQVSVGHLAWGDEWDKAIKICKIFLSVSDIAKQSTERIVDLLLTRSRVPANFVEYLCPIPYKLCFNSESVGLVKIATQFPISILVPALYSVCNQCVFFYTRPSSLTGQSSGVHRSRAVFISRLLSFLRSSIYLFCFWTKQNARRQFRWTCDYI